MTIRYPLEHKFRVDGILKDRWRERIPTGRGDALIRAFMNKLVEEVERGGEELLYQLEVGNFSLLKATETKGTPPSRVYRRSPTSGRFLHNEDEGVSYDPRLKK